VVFPFACFPAPGTKSFLVTVQRLLSALRRPAGDVPGAAKLRPTWASRLASPQRINKTGAAISTSCSDGKRRKYRAFRVRTDSPNASGRQDLSLTTPKFGTKAGHRGSTGLTRFGRSGREALAQTGCFALPRSGNPARSFAEWGPAAQTRIASRRLKRATAANLRCRMSKRQSLAYQTSKQGRHAKRQAPSQGIEKPPKNPRLVSNQA
jgi:hypothetical protein